jgi:hypothetical protein
MNQETILKGRSAPAKDGGADHSFILIILMLLVVFAPILCLHAYFILSGARSAIETVQEYREPVRHKPASG